MQNIISNTFKTLSLSYAAKTGQGADSINLLLIECLDNIDKNSYVEVEDQSYKTLPVHEYDRTADAIIGHAYKATYGYNATSRSELAKIGCIAFVYQIPSYAISNNITLNSISNITLTGDRYLDKGVKIYAEEIDSLIELKKLNDLISLDNTTVYCNTNDQTDESGQSLAPNKRHGVTQSNISIAVHNASVTKKYLVLYLYLADYLENRGAWIEGGAILANESISLNFDQDIENPDIYDNPDEQLIFTNNEIIRYQNGTTWYSGIANYNISRCIFSHVTFPTNAFGTSSNTKFQSRVWTGSAEDYMLLNNEMNYANNVEESISQGRSMSNSFQTEDGYYVQSSNGLYGTHSQFSGIRQLGDFIKYQYLSTKHYNNSCDLEDGTTVFGVRNIKTTTEDRGVLNYSGLILGFVIPKFDIYTKLIYDGFIDNLNNTLFDIRIYTYSNYPAIGNFGGLLNNMAGGYAKYDMDYVDLNSPIKLNAGDSTLQYLPIFARYISGVSPFADLNSLFNGTANSLLLGGTCTTCGYNTKKYVSEDQYIDCVRQTIDIRLLAKQDKVDLNNLNVKFDRELIEQDHGILIVLKPNRITSLFQTSLNYNNFKLV